MKIRAIFLSLTFSLGLMCQSAYATQLLEATGIIEGGDTIQFEFTIDQSLLQYDVTSAGHNILSFFDSLSITIATLSNPVATLFAPGTMSFEATFGTTYFARGSGDAGREQEVGLFGLLIKATAQPVPEPATLMLLGTGLVGILGSRFRRKK